MVVTTLALGLRKLRAEVRRRVGAWKILASTSDPNEPLGSQPTISQPSHTTNRALSPPRRSSFQSSFLQWFNAGGSHYIRSLRWAVPTVETAASRMRSATNFSARASQAKIAGALTPVGVPFNSPDGPSWGPGYTEWDVAIRLFNTPCECGIPHTPRSPGIFKRCVRCYGYSLTGILPKSACCTLCREPSSLVCVVCLQGFHVNSKCGLGTGANMVYCRQDLDGCHACPDCMWSWVNSLNMRANEIPSHQQIELTSIMEKAASTFEASHNSITTFVKNFISKRVATKRDVIVSLHGHNKLERLSMSGASDKIEHLINTGDMEVCDGICRWKSRVDSLSPPLESTQFCRPTTGAPPVKRARKW